jgi:hypothetical protein
MVRQYRCTNMKQPKLNHLHLDDLPSHVSGNYWTLAEVGELIRRIGTFHDFDVIPELPLSKGRRIDWVWLSKEHKKALACFEIEGSNAPPRSIEADLERFRELQCQQNFIVTYGRRYRKDARDIIDLHPDNSQRIQQWITEGRASPRVVLLAHTEHLGLPQRLWDIAQKLISRGRASRHSVMTSANKRSRWKTDPSQRR